MPYIHFLIRTLEAIRNGQFRRYEKDARCKNVIIIIFSFDLPQFVEKLKNIRSKEECNKKKSIK